ncbi:MAG: extracellular solute-binding protein [Ruminococcaceae bacterium]|nr:extracellular solute-binding protein [Oscillospiraceae bacterium]
MKKFACLILAVFVMVTVLAGCGGTSQNGTTAAGATTAVSSDAVTLKFVRIGNDTAEADYWKSLIDRFQKENEGIIIEYDDAAIGEAMETKLNTMFSGGMGPDLIGHGIMSVAARAEAGQYMDITEYYNSWEGKDDIMKAVLANGTYNDRIYGLAYSTTPFVFAYRTDLFEKAGLDPNSPPETWEQLAEYARKLTVKDGDNVTLAGFAFPMTAGNFVEFDVFAFGNGALYYDEAGNPTIDTPEKAEAFDFLMSFLDEVNMPYSATDVNPFINGNAAMTLINNVALTPMLTSDEYAGKVAIATPPTNGTDATFCGCNMLFIGGTSKYADEAFEFIKTALSADEVLNRAKVLNVPVTRTSQIDAFVALDPMNAVRARCVEIGIGMPRTTWAASFQTIRNQMVQNVLYGEATPAEALAEAQATLLDEIG